MLPLHVLLVALVSMARADYNCTCNYDIEASVYPDVTMTGNPIGYLYKYDCAATYGKPTTPGSIPVVFQAKVGYLRDGANLGVENCFGTPPTAPPTTTTATTRPISTVAPVTPTTTPIAKTSPSPTTTPTATTTPTTIEPSSTSMSTTTHGIVEGNTALCPSYLQTDAARNGGFLGQLGRYCYELVNTATQWGIAERHCKLASSGHLVYIMSQAEQDYIVRFLAKHHYVQKVWTGLSDTDKEGTWAWSSNVTVAYTNFQRHYNSHSGQQHNLNDCIVLEQGGQWTDLPCGVSLIASVGFGEHHPYLCKHQINSTMFSEFEHLGPALIG